MTSIEAPQRVYPDQEQAIFKVLEMQTLLNDAMHKRGSLGPSELAELDMIIGEILELDEDLSLKVIERFELEQISGEL